MLDPRETGARLQEQGSPHLCDHPVAAAEQLWHLSRDGIHECTIFVRVSTWRFCLSTKCYS
jgi:hypothetical protein